MCLLEGNFPFIIKSVVLVSREAHPVPSGVVHLRGLEGGFFSYLLGSAGFQGDGLTF